MSGKSDRRAGTAWAAYAACGVALLNALVSFYWALGGTVGIGTLGGRLEELAKNDDPVVLWLAGAAGVLKLAGAGLALALTRPWGPLASRLLVATGWAGAVVLVGYVGLNVVVGGLALSGVIEPGGPVDRIALWWHVLVWDLWFLVWGVLLGLAARQFGRRHRHAEQTPGPGRRGAGG